MAKQYCRYCANCVLVDEDVCYCEISKTTFVGSKAKSVNQCKNFDFNELDVFNIERKYKPIEGRKSPQRKSDNDEQISLYR